jgi:hypothetical protein
VNKLCKTRADLALAFSEAAAIIAKGKAALVRVEEKDPRSIDQNSLSHQWYTELALTLPEYDAQGWRRYCKLHFAVPLARAEIPEFRAFYDGALKGLAYEQKAEAMDFVPVTSLFNKAQFTKYLDALRADFAKRGVLLDIA